MNKSIFTKGIYVFLSLLLALGAFTAMPSGAVSAANLDVCASGCTYSTIQSAINAASDNDTVYVHAGTYYEALSITKTISLVGEDRDLVIIDTDSSAGTSYGVSVRADGVVISDLTVVGPNNYTGGTRPGNYGIKVSKVDDVTDTSFTISNVKIRDSYRSNLDLNGITSGLIDGVIVENAVYGAGIGISDSSNITVQNITTTGNAWGGLAVMAGGNWYPPGGSYNVTLTGTNSFSETNKVYTENEADPTKPVVNFTAEGFGFIVRNPIRPYHTWYQITAADAVSFALELANPEQSVVQRLSDGAFILDEGMSIQAAIDAAADGDTVFVQDGTYNEYLRINKPLTLSGESKTGVIIDPQDTGGYGIAATADGLVFENFTLQNAQTFGLKISGSTNVVVQNVIVQASGNTNVDLNGVNHANLDAVEAYNASSGNGFSITDSNDILISNSISEGNHFTTFSGGVMVAASGEYYTGGSDNIVFSNNDFREPTHIYTERNATYEITNLDPGNYDYVLKTSLGLGESYYVSFAEAKAAAVLYADALLSGDLSSFSIKSVSLATFYVDPDLKIQTAVNAAEAGDSVYVWDGTYVVPQLVITSDLSIMGESQSGTIITPFENTGSAGDSRGWFVVNAGVEFNLTNVTLDGNGKNVYQAIRSFGTGIIDSCTFKNITYPTYNGMAIVNVNANMTITNNNFLNIGRVGIFVYGPGVTNTQVFYNTYAGKGDGDWLDYGIEIGAGAVADIEGNIISGNTGVASTDGSTSAGILATTFYGDGTTATILNNQVTGCTTAIAVGYDDTDTSLVIANYNQFVGNEYGLSTTAAPVDAQFNWWGDESGPSGIGLGAGDSVEVGIDYSPWLGFVPGTSPMTFHTNDSIQDAIDVASAGDTVNVYPGNYDEFAYDRHLFNGSGPYQFGLFVSVDKADLTIQGVTADGAPITSYADVLAQVQLNPNNSFGFSGMFVEANGVTVSGLGISPHPDKLNKTIEVIGDAFTLQNSHVNAIDYSGVYINDWRYDTDTDVSYVQSYTIDGNWIENGSIDVNNGAGYSGAVSGRLITNNKITNNGEYAAVSFTGSDTGVPWFVESVGGAVITGNEFVGNDQHIRARGIYDNGQFDWASYWNENTFDKAVIVGVNPPNDVRTFTYTTSYGTMPDVRRIGGVIQGEIDHALSGDTVLVKDGVYTENLVIGTDLTIIGESLDTIVQSPDIIPLCYSDKKPIVCVQDSEVVLSTLTVDGAGKGNVNNSFIGVGYRNAGGTVQNARIIGIENTPFSGTQHGVAMYVYNDDTVGRSFTIDNVFITDFQKNAMAINASDDTPLTVAVLNNEIIGHGPTTITAQNGIQVNGNLITGSIENNVISGIGYDNTASEIKWVATSILNFYADVDVIGNTITEAQTALYNMDGGGYFTNNEIEVNKVGVSGYGMILTDPPAAVPSPFIEESVSVSSDSKLAVKSATENVVVLEGNIVTFVGSDNAGTIGVEADAGYDVKDMHVTLIQNTVMGFDAGIAFLQYLGADATDAVFTNLDMNFNRIVNNTVGLYSDVDYMSVNAENNWWGCNEGPGATDCDPIDGTGAVDADPWIVLSLTANPDTLEPGMSADLEANLVMNSAGVSTAADGYIPQGLLVSFTAPDGGTVNPTSGLTVNSAVSSVFTAPDMHGDYQVCAAVDNELLCPIVPVVGPGAVDDFYSTPEDTTLVESAPGVLTNDTGIETLPYAVALLVEPQHGQLTLNADGSFTYVPDAGFVGDDTFEYQVVTHPNDAKTGWSDEAMVTITVTPVNKVPVAVADAYDAVQNITLEIETAEGVLANDTDADVDDSLEAVLVTDVSNGTLTLNADGSFTYVPNVNYVGFDSFTYYATDGEANSAPVTVTITVAPGIPVTGDPILIYLPFIVR